MMLDEKEFEAILARTDAFMKSYLECKERASPRDLFDKGLDLCRAAIHVQEGRMCGLFDSRLQLLKLAESMVEASYLPKMSKLDGTSGPEPAMLDLLTRAKFSKNYDESYFKDNSFEAEVIFPNLWYGMNFASEFIKTLPTLDIEGLPRELVAQALGADLMKVTAMIVWSSALAIEHGHRAAVENIHEIMEKLYSLKYGIGIGSFGPKEIKDVCDFTLPWVEALKETVVGNRSETQLN